jgi:glycine/D-amino acid oxidase-like deaminating enzyme
MKRKLDLRTGKPVWSAYRAPAVPVSSLTRDIRTDVLVIGMGISGAMIAEALASDGHAVVCIDRRGPLLGSTAATTALVQFEIDQPLSVLTRKIGREKAERAWRRSRLSVLNLQSRIRERAIECRLEPRPSLFLDGNVLSPSLLREEGLARRRAGLRSDYLVPSEMEQRFGIVGRSALIGHGNLALDPRKLTAGMLLAAVDRGARLYSPVEATGIETSASGVEIATSDGPTIRAKNLVLATGYELLDMVPKTDHQVISTWAMATKPQKQAVWPEEAFIWEASDPYLYMRVLHDGRVVCGGEDEEFMDEERRDALTAEKIETIARKLGKLFPRLDTTPDYAWAGAFGTTPTGLPIIGRVPRRPNVFAVMGYGGNGITYSQIASEIIATAVSGDSDNDEDLYALT